MCRPSLDTWRKWHQYVMYNPTPAWAVVIFVLNFRARASSDNMLRFQSINQMSVAPRSPAKPGSAARQLNQCSTAKSKQRFRDINRPSGILVSTEESPSQRDVSLQMFLESSNWNGWTDRHLQVVPKRQVTRVKRSCTCIGLDPRDWQTITSVKM